MRRSKGAVLAVLAALLTACSSSGGGPGPLGTITSSSSTGSASTGSTSTSSTSTSSTSSREVSFVVDGTTTYGTIETPAHRSGQRLAAALLIPGSGPTDRDGNDTKLGLTVATLRLIADRLAAQGIMTLRYDKYFAGKTGGGTYAADPSKITIDQFFTQADAAYNLLAHQSDADPTKLLVVGHSEGGMIALKVAGSVSPKPAGLALLEPQDQRILNLILIQLDEAIDGLVAQGTLTAAQGRSNAMQVAQAISAFRAGQSVNLSALAPQVEQQLAPLITGTTANFVRSNDQVVPAQLAAAVQSGTQVLVTVGTRDTNVPPRTVAPLMASLTTAGVSGPKLVRLAGVDHLLHTADQPDTQAVLAPSFVAALTRWATPFAA